MHMGNGDRPAINRRFAYKLAKSVAITAGGNNKPVEAKVSASALGKVHLTQTHTLGDGARLQDVLMCTNQP